MFLGAGMPLGNFRASFVSPSVFRALSMPSVVLGSNQPLPQIPHGAGSSSNNNNNVGGRGGGGGGGGSGGMMGAGGNMEGVDDSFRESPFYVPEIPSFGTRSPTRGSRS